MAKRNTLTAREAMFCGYFSQGRDARGAAAKAGYTVLPERAAAKLLQRKDILARIAETDRQRTATLEECCAGYRRLAFGSVTDALRLLFSEDLPDPQTLEQLDTLNISDIKRPKGGGLEIKFFDRLKALEKLREISGTEAARDTAAPFYRALAESARSLSAVSPPKAHEHAV